MSDDIKNNNQYQLFDYVYGLTLRKLYKELNFFNQSDLKSSEIDPSSYKSLQDDKDETNVMIEEFLNEHKGEESSDQNDFTI